MNNWTASSHTPTSGCPVTRYANAVAAAGTAWSRLSSAVATARRDGVESRDLLSIPFVRNAARAAKQAVTEYGEARDLLPAGAVPAV
jgi:hypothetical protein